MLKKEKKYNSLCLKTMKPRTKIQREVAELSDYRLPNIGIAVEAWAERTCLPKVGYRNKSRIACLECGYTWDRDTNRKECRCPNCQARLRLKDTKARKLTQEAYFSVVQTLDRFQVNRFFIITGRYRVGERADFRIVEVCQQWLLENGKYVIYAQRHKVNWSQDYWVGEFEIRSNTAPQYWRQNLYNIYVYNVYPKVEVLPIFRKRGLSNITLKDTYPLDLMTSILEDNRAESLLKMRQKSLLEYYLRDRSRSRVDRYWRSICICQRHRYKVQDASLWFDYLDCLEFLSKDLRNPHYICPKNLKEAHDRAIEQKRKLEKEREERVVFQEEVDYAKAKEKFIGLSFSSKGISISVLGSVKEFKEEGETMHHCVYSNKYYRKEKSLILSAQIKGEKVATVELSLETWTIIQCRGRCNSEPPKNKEIIKLVERSIPKLQERAIG